MASIALLAVAIAFVSFPMFHFFLNRKRTHESFPRAWPFLGMLPGSVVMLPRLFHWAVDILENSGLTFAWKGPWFTGMDMLATVDPANIHHIMCSNFANYPKGPEFKEVFQVLGDGIFNADLELWENLRKSSQAILNHLGFQRFSFRTNMDKVKKGIVPLLDHVARAKMVVDIQDVFERYVFDTMFTLCTGYDPETLSIEMPDAEFSKAFNVVEETLVYRHVKPRILWKLQNWLGLGIEKEMRRACATLDRICAKYISAKREEMSAGLLSKTEATDLLTSYMNVGPAKYKLLNPNDEKFQRDTIITFMTAGRGTGYTLAWFFWLLSKNPNVLSKIRQEIRTKMPRIQIPGRDEEDEEAFDPKELKKLVYLHAALCETLRLYPVVPFQRKTPIKPDVLPSGHRVGVNSKILIISYVMGRMKAVWGEDASDFKPDRWISANGGLRQEPPAKFFVFNAGPRICLGKEMAFTQLKMVLVKIIPNYDIEVVEGQNVEPNVAALLRIKDGLRVRITKRCSA